MPSEKLDQHESNDQVEASVGRGDSSGGKEWKDRDLERVGGKSDRPSRPVLGTAKLAEVVEPTSELHGELDAGRDGEI